MRKLDEEQTMAHQYFTTDCLPTSTPDYYVTLSKENTNHTILQNVPAKADQSREIASPVIVETDATASQDTQSLFYSPTLSLKEQLPKLGVTSRPTKKTMLPKPEMNLRKIALKSCAEWTSKKNCERPVCSLDQQTGTVHYPQKKKIVMESPKIGKSPVALLAGQFEDSYNRYTTEELKYMPMNTVLYGPLVENYTADSTDESSDSDSGDK